MAIPFLNHLDLKSKAELRNALLHKTTEGNASDTEAAIIYDTEDHSLKYHNGSGWIELDGSGDISAVNTSSGSGLSGGSEDGAVNLQVVVDTVTLEISTNTIQAKTAAIADSGTGLATADQIHTFVTGYADPAGTQNSTDVTLVTTSHDYLSISGQAITLGAVQLGSTGQDVTGTLPIANGGTGQTTAASAANALLNVSQGGALAIGDSSDTITIAGDLIVTGTQTIQNETVQVIENNTIQFEGTTANDYEIKLTGGDPTADRTVTLPDNSGTIALTGDIDDGTITITAGNGLVTGGTFTLNGGAAEITIDHEDTSSQASVDNSGLTVVQDVTLDTYGHTTGLASVDLTSGIDGRITAREYSALIGDGSATTLILKNTGATGTAQSNHGLGADSTSFMVQLIEVSSGATAYADVNRAASGVVNIVFAEAPASNAIRVLINKIG